jgi:hypothetical protein
VLHCQINAQYRRTRRELFPVLSRIQNIEPCAAKQPRIYSFPASPDSLLT